MTTAQIHLRISSILKFMEPYWSLVNCHMVNFLTDKHWQNYIPLELQSEIPSSDSIDECIKYVFWSPEEVENSYNKFFECIKFKRKAYEHSLHHFNDVVLPQEDFEKTILGMEIITNQQIKIKEFLTEKKRHEVEITAGLVNDIIVSTSKTKETYIVDAGDGKGYLSSRLSLEYGHKVLGIDSNPSNTKNAIERNHKLKKAWNGLKERAELESKGVTPPRRGKQKQKTISGEEFPITALPENENYKTIDKFITSDMDLKRLIEEEFPECQSSPAPNICLTGLHTCGNLASTCLKLFHSQPDCKVLCNIGCCYHLLKEMYSGPEFFGNKQIEQKNQETGFPLSKYLQEKHITLGRNARMLSAQSLERTMDAKELPNISLFYRAMLELLICEQHPELKDTIQVGKIRKFNNFEEYVELCCKKYPNLKASLDRIKYIKRKQESSGAKKYLDLFYLLRMTFAPVLESLILLDRLLYLQEMGHTQSFLIPVFDAVVSPRHFAIVAIKNFTSN